MQTKTTALVFLGAIIVAGVVAFNFQRRVAEFELVGQGYYPYGENYPGDYLGVIVVKDLGGSGEKPFWKCYYDFKPMPEESTLNLKPGRRIVVTYNSWFWFGRSGKENALFASLRKDRPTSFVKRSEVDPALIEPHLRVMVINFLERGY